MWRVDSLEKSLMLGGIGGRREGAYRGWDGWMASPTQWRWVWVNSGGWWWTGRPGVLRFMGSQRVGHDWATELNWTEWLNIVRHFSPVGNLYMFFEKMSIQEFCLWMFGFSRSFFKGLKQTLGPIFSIIFHCFYLLIYFELDNFSNK